MVIKAGYTPMRLAPAHSAPSATVQQLSHGKNVPEHPRLLQGLKRMAGVLGDADQACGYLDQILASSTQPEQTVDDYVDLLKVSDARDPRTLATVLLALEHRPNPDGVKGFRSLLKGSELPVADAYTHHCWLEETYADQARERALKLSCQVADMAPTASLKPTVEWLMEQKEPERAIGELVRLGRLGLTFEQALGDLQAVGEPSKKSYAVLEQIRREVPSEDSSVRQAVSLLRDNQALTPTYLRLLDYQVSAVEANTVLTTLCHYPEADPGPLLELLADASPRERRQVYDAFISVAQLPQPASKGWLLDKLGFGISNEEAFRDLTRMHKSPQMALEDLKVLTSDPAQSLSDGLGLLKDLYLVDQTDSASCAREAFAYLRQADNRKHLGLVKKMASDLSSLRLAARAVEGLTADKPARSALRDRLDTFYARLQSSSSPAAAVNWTLAEGRCLAAGFTPEQFERLARKGSGDFLMVLAEGAANLGKLLGDQREGLAEVLGLCTNPSQLNSVASYLEAGAGPLRLKIVDRLSRAFGSLDKALEDCTSLAERFDGKNEVADAYSQLATVLPAGSRDKLREHLEWAVSQNEKPRYKRIPPERFLMELGKALLLDPDTEKARQIVMSALEPELGLIDEEDYLVVGDFMVEKHDER